LDDELKWGEEPPAWSSYSDSIASFAAVFTASATILTAKRDVAAIAMPPWHRNKFEKLTETARCVAVCFMLEQSKEEDARPGQSFPCN
jgi:hypothetical protein